MQSDSTLRTLAAIAAKWAKDPLRFVKGAFPWGTGPLEGSAGPDKWQTQLLSELRDRLQAGESRDDVIRTAVAAGHGVGKSGLVAWIILWAISTAVDTRGVVTANTDTQLRTKTWAELAKWYHCCVFRPLFELTATALISKDPGHDKTWRIDAIPWSESNPEAFAGLHNKGRRLLVIFDEASAISPRIWEVVEGAMTDTGSEILWLCFGNPTRNTGRFFDCFNRLRHRWFTMHVDARDSAVASQSQIAAWLEDYGEESDFFRVRVRGVFPSGSDMQFIPRSVVDSSVSRELGHISLSSSIAIIGADVARFGADSSVLRVRIGMDARTWQKREFKNLDGWQLGAKVAELYNEVLRSGVHSVIINMDAGGVGASPIDWLRKNGYQVNAINFGDKPLDPRQYLNLRAEMWGKMKQWLKDGGCIPNDSDLITDLTGVEYDFNVKNQLQLEKKSDMKARGLASPDNADALALTFALPVNETVTAIPRPIGTQRRPGIRDPFRTGRW